MIKRAEKYDGISPLFFVKGLFPEALLQCDRAVENQMIG